MKDIFAELRQGSYNTWCSDRPACGVEKTTSTSEMRKTRLMIVEDESIVALDLQSRLESLGYEVVAMAASGDSAIRDAFATSPDLILMDVKIKGAMDGIDTAERIRARRDIPIIFLTAFADQKTLDRARLAAPYGYILKPFEERELSINIEFTLHRHHLEQALRKSEERYMLAVRGSNDGIWDWDLTSNTIFFSTRWKQMLGLADTELGGTPEEWFGLVHPDDLDQFKLEIAAHLDGTRPAIDIEHRMLCGGGAVRWVLTRGLALRDASGRPLRISGSLTDITRRKLAEEQLVFDAFHDILTGLPNRALFFDRLGRSMERYQRYNEAYAVLFLDLDRFKLINDSLGHTAGDQLLVTAARRLENLVRSCDTVARLGGDEYVMLIENIAGVQDAEQVASRIQSELSSALNLNGQALTITASIGIVIASPEYTQPVEVLRDADIAMYHAKSLGKARYAIFEPGMRTQMITNLDLETRLRTALQNNEFELLYQPIYSLLDDQMTGFEALLRWHPQGEATVMPARFIPIAEETGLIIPIGEWVMRTACAQLRDWQAAFPDRKLTVSVNLTSRQITKPGFASDVQRILGETALDPASLQLEVTESFLMENTTLAQAILTQLARMGIQIALDDFGIGYSSLSYLQHFPIQAIKIDRSFINLLRVNEQSDEIVKMIVRLSRELEMDTVAEGIETDQQLSQLKKIRCRFGQGYLFAAPLEPRDVENLLAKTPPPAM